MRPWLINSERLLDDLKQVASRGGISHNPDEFSEPDALVTGTNVLFETLRRLIGQSKGDIA